MDKLGSMYVCSVAYYNEIKANLLTSYNQRKKPNSVVVKYNIEFILVVYL